MTRLPRRGLAAALFACGLFAPGAEAIVRNEKPALAEKVVRHPSLQIPTRLQPAVELQDELGARIQRDLAALGIGGESAFYDARAGRLTSFILSEPLIPGDGAGNALRWGAAGRPDEEGFKEAAWSAVRGFLQDRQALLKVDVAELGAPRVGVFEGGNLVQVYSQRVLDGIPVRDSSVTAVINHGNLVLLGLDHWGDAARGEGVPALGETQAQLRVAQHAAPYDVESIEKGGLEYIPMVNGEGYAYRLAWVVRLGIAGDLGSWEGLVDAATGELLAFEDRNQYSRRVIGGVYPVSNDQRPPDGVEQAGWPMPRGTVNVAGSPVTTTSSGTFGCPVGALSFALTGPFVRMADVCGPANETAPGPGGDLDLGSGPTPTATDCVVPPGHSAGDTKASRSGFYEVNRIKEQAVGYLPTNTWLMNQLTSNMNINQTCNAFWNGSTINFYRDNGSSCRNTGEIAAIFDHEWGHGMDANGINPNISPPGEGIADIHAFLRLSDSCIGRGFFKNQVCGGYGDPCDPPVATGCTGIRQMDFMGHVCDRPHTVTWITSGFTAAQCFGVARPPCPGAGNTPCGRATHCEGKVVSETAYDLARRDLTAPPFSYDSNTAHELSTRLFFLGSQAVGSWFTCAVGGGCAATGGYMQVLAADDDNGNLNDGTPHMSAIRAAFERHEIHCATPPVLNVGCVGGPLLAPVVTATAGPESVDLSWTPVPDAARYFVYRTEGVSACDFGKIKIADVTTTSFSDTGLMEGRAYSYIVLPVGANTSCFGLASACANATPTASVCAPIADFTLACNPAALAANQGGNATSACTVQSLNAFSSAVDLSCTGLPATITCGYNPNPVTPPSNGTVDSTLTVSVGATTAPGTYNFQARGVSGSLTHTFNMSIAVTAVADYSLSCNPSSLSVAQGGNGTSTCTVQSINAFSSAVTFSCTGLPAGVTCSYNPPTVTPPANGTASSTLTVTVPAGTPTGTYSFQAQGTSGAMTRTFNMSLEVFTQSVEPFALAVDTGGNSVFQPNETVIMAPTWRNTGTTPINLTGVTSNFTGPAGAVYANPDNTANYGTIGVAAQANCATNGNCYSVLATAATRPLTHWDSTILETVTPTSTTKTWTLHIGDSFTDVPPSSGFYRFIETILHKNVTGGCTTTTYCPLNSTTRAQMAVFVLVSKEPPGYNPPACVAGSEMFADVPASSGFCRWIEELARRGVVSGCGGGNYCPQNPATREQMAVFVLRTLDPALNPPPCGTPMFNDVPASSPFCRWIEELVRRGVVTGCGGGNYCPTANVTRAQMSVFLAATFGLVLYGL